MELKTLKDFIEDWKNNPNDEANDYQKAVADDISKELKQEAINWIKDFRNQCDDCKSLEKDKYKIPICWRCAFWMKRLSITKEELK